MQRFKIAIVTAYQALGRYLGSFVGRFVASRSSLRDYKNLFDRFGMGLVVLNRHGEVIACNVPYARLTGRTSVADVVGHSAREWLDPRFHQGFEGFLANAKPPNSIREPVAYRRPDGTQCWVEAHTLVHNGPSGKVFVVAVTDVSAQREVQMALRLCEQAIESTTNAVAITKVKQSERRFVYVNPAYERMTGYDASELLALDASAINQLPGNDKIYKRLIEETQANGSASATLLTARKDGSVLRRHVTSSRIRHDLDDAEYNVTVSYDVTESEKMAERLRLLSRALEAAQSGLMITRVDGKDHPIEMVNQAFQWITGYSAEEVIGRDARFLQCEGAEPAVLERVRNAVRSGRSVSAVLENCRKDGTHFWNELHIDPVKDEAGTITHFIGVINDVTAQRDAAARMNQLQKLKAIGHLTGGIAHDFNNLLTVIVGNLRLMEASSTDPTLQRRLTLALSAAQRGSDLTQRLSAYSRTQQLKEEVVEINELISGLEPLLHRTLGAHINIRSVLAPDVWGTVLDRGQLENALLNLVINARDAMENGGDLTITTANIHVNSLNTEIELNAGDYVQLTVTDTGAGMTKEVRERAFEPFFTTKEVGKGTGLGLSSVYGFVKQSGGHVSIYSELGLGTSVKLYLPRSDVKPASVPYSPETIADAIGAGETILLVEDDAEVRGTTRSILEHFGYRIIDAATASDALATLRQRDDIALVLSDVIMPGTLTGYDLFKEVRRLRPQLPVLLTTGYPRDAIPRHVKGDDEPALIPKPFNIDQLMRVIRAEIGPPNPNRPGYERQTSEPAALTTAYCDREAQP